VFHVSRRVLSAIVDNGRQQPICTEIEVNQAMLTDRRRLRHALCAALLLSASPVHAADEAAARPRWGFKGIGDPGSGYGRWRC
jgi:hypothetical protein